MKKKRIKVQDKIQEVIKSFPKGSIFFAQDFLEYGNIGSIRKALTRLTNKEFLVRLAHGIYLYPKIDEELGLLVPSTEYIVNSIARRDNVRIAHSGNYALNRLGLSTQVPAKSVYLTDGSTRIVKVGRRTITFIHASPNNLAAKGQISGLAIQALKMIGKKNVNDKIIAKIEEVLQHEKKENILHDAKLAPVWIHNTLTRAIQ
jgi:hypothetical protein